jgi:putative hydrolase of the HAD superfamily
VEPSEEACSEAVELRFDYELRVIVPRPSAEETLREIRRQGYRTGLISDCSSELPVLWKETLFSPLFDVTLFSSQVGMRKPDPAIFLLACRELQVDPGNCIYVGDGGSRELSGAAGVGMHPLLLYDRNEQNNADTHRVDGEVWEGQMISDLKELLDILKESG